MGKWWQSPGFATKTATSELARERTTRTDLLKWRTDKKAQSRQ
jgi:hypothetical protein